MGQRLCLHCEKELIGRADKKFCDRQCRNDYNNTQNSASNNYIRKVNRIIKNNRNVLESLCPKDRSVKVHLKDLSKAKVLASNIFQIPIQQKQKRSTTFVTNTDI